MINVHIFASKLDVYVDSIRIESEKCDMASYKKSSPSFFQYFFAIRLKNVNYPRKWCPHFFRDFDLDSLELFDITNSFLIKNRLIFFPTNSSVLYIKYLRLLVLSITYENLDRNNLSPDLFKKIRILGITGVINGIESNLFKDFKNLQIIDLGLSNFKEFFHMGIQWMNSLNVDKKHVLRLSFQYLNNIVSFDSIYEYPNEDLCLFKDFPHKNLVYPLLVPRKKLKCTCTIYWLQKNLNDYENEISITYEYSSNYKGELMVRIFKFCNSSFDSSQECQFEKRFKMCQIIEYKGGHKFDFQIDFDILYLIKLLEFNLLVILAPILAFLGIINNVLTIFIIRNKNMKKDFEESMYKHIIINSVFNIFFCVIMILKLINTCIFFGPSIFCSNVYQEDWAQNFKIILIHFLGNATKMCSNFSYLAFSLSRLLLVTRQKESDQNSKSHFKNRLVFIYIFLLTLISLILSCFKLFQYRKNEDFIMSKEFPYEIRDEQYCENIINKFQCELFNALKLFNGSLNDILFVILNIIVDLILLIKFKKIIDSKLRQISDLAHYKLIEKSKKNLNRMILLNSFIYIFSHLPEFVMTLLLIIYSKKILNFCKNEFSCDLLNEEAEVFGLISIVCQFYVFKIFDKHFRRSIEEIKSNIYFFIFRQRAN